ncbi:hypothetical protein D9619_005205 [Psilocybe cf. subviscida]|uniref:RING-type domain-containing protein n=1 Tax=Psilocybe cf. subviscida TaxID=2480587 RepID=A0A8H5BYQ3_9AGAR|nr:hypothetical protein D9619_005205 [Psilocybe cf. subviscida]
MSSNLATLASNAGLTNGASSTTPAAWRQFTFFDAVQVKDVHDLNSTPDIFKATPEISTAIPSSAGAIVADIHGSVHILNREFESTTSWVAHVGGRVTHMVERKGILITLGEEDSVRSPLLKIWDLETKDKKSGAPSLLRSTKVQLNNRPHPVTTVEVSDGLAHLAIGLGDGTVILYRHLDQSLSSSTSLTSLPKARTVHESATEPITGLGFREPGDDNTNTYLFIVTTNRVLSYQVSGRNSGGAPAEADEIGAGLGCATMDWKGKNIVVARDEAVYLCGIEGRGTCYAYEGTKSSIYTHANYLIIVTPPFFPTATSPSATVRNLVARMPNATETDVTKVTVFDAENKLVAYSGTFKQGVREIISQWGKIYVLSSDGTLMCLEEKSTAAKLDMLYRKSLYLIALNLASTQSLDESSVADIHKQYGDHLYGKGDYDGAMQQYVQTIGHLQPSYVVRKYLDAQRIHNLVTYLQELHSLGLANADHTTLLLNTYTKLKDVARLDSFIKTESRRQVDPSDNTVTEELPFDLTTAIRVLRQAGYFEHAGYLAKRYERHEDYLRIQIEDAGNYRDALAYLRKLGPEAAESNLARYGRAMLQHLPEETTQLLIDLCTNTGPLSGVSTTEDAPQTATSPPDGSGSKIAAPAPSYLSYLALSRGATATTVVSSETATPPSPSIKTVRAGTTDNGHSRRQSTMDTATTSGSSDTPPPTAVPANASRAGLPPGSASGATFPASAALPPPPPPPPKRLSPRVYFAHFVDHMGQFVGFLETVAQRRWGQSVEDQKPGGPITTQQHGRSQSVFSEESEDAGGVYRTEEDEELVDRQDQVAVWNTLLELYLTLPVKTGAGATDNKDAKQKPFDEAHMRDKALRVLSRAGIPYDPTHALVLCSTYGFTPGLVLLWERMGMYEDVLRFWMDRDREGVAGASAKVLEHLMQYGTKAPAESRRLYPLVLRFLTSTPELLGRHREDVKDILEYIDEEEMIPPLGVIQVLSRNGVASVGLVKEWMVERIKKSRVEIQNDQELTKSYRLETAQRLKQVQELSSTDESKVFHVTRCTKCLGQLDLPSLHFMCNHSYHQRCLADNEHECPACVREHAVIREIRQTNAKLADQHDIFLSEVQENGFEAVASAYGRGVLNASFLAETAAV